MRRLFGTSTKKPEAPTAVETIQMFDDRIALVNKKIDFLQQRIDKETSTAKANSTRNKRVAMAALKRRQMYQTQQSKLEGMIMNMETQKGAIEGAAMNMDTMAAMRQGQRTMERMHNGMRVEDVEQTVDDIQEQMDVADEISDALSTPLGTAQFDDDALMEELMQMEAESVDERMMALSHEAAGLPSTPVTQLPTVNAPAAAATPAAKTTAEDDELAALEAEYGM